MVFPTVFQPNNITNLHYFQGVLIAEVALTLVLYLILKIIHYVKWGHDEEMVVDKPEEKNAEEDAG